MDKLDFLLAGVGGQGTILAGDILAEVGLRAGYDAKKSEVHGMSQRGGQVESHVRWGRRVYSPLVEKGRADFLLGFELLEAARWAEFVAPGGWALLNRYRIPPLAVTAAGEKYPSDEEVCSLFRHRGVNVWWLDAIGVARSLGPTALAGVALLGALSRRLPVPAATWLEAIEELVPARFVELNRQAFQMGSELPPPAADACEGVS